MSYLKDLKGKIKASEPLSKHTTFRIGGKVKLFAEPADCDDLKLLLKYAKGRKLKVLPIGWGSNILARDEKIDKLAVSLNSSCFKKIEFNGNYCCAGSGVALAQLVRVGREHSLSGFEFLAGVPGTVGGAIAGNAGAQGKEIADILTEVQVMDYNGRQKTLKKKQLKFGYRSSSLDKCIILGALFKLNAGLKKDIKNRVNTYLAKRRQAQDTAYPNAGCIFKNHRSESAGKLIDLCGLKGRRSGGAMISDKHANFILNRDNAEAKDILALIRLARKQVKDKFGIKLETEIKIWQ